MSSDQHNTNVTWELIRSVDCPAAPDTELGTLGLEPNNLGLKDPLGNFQTS